MSEQTPEAAGMLPEHEAGTRRLRLLLPTLATYHDPSDTEERDVCRACGDCECGGACPLAMEIVRQVIEDLGHGDDSWEWWVSYFEDDGITIPSGGDS